jgi:hypothetical protein
MVEDRKKYERGRRSKKKLRNPCGRFPWKAPMSGKGKKKLKTKKLRNSEACCTKEEKTEKEVNSGRRRKGK